MHSDSTCKQQLCSQVLQKLQLRWRRRRRKPFSLSLPIGRKRTASKTWQKTNLLSIRVQNVSVLFFPVQLLLLLLFALAAGEASLVGAVGSQSVRALAVVPTGTSSQRTSSGGSLSSPAKSHDGVSQDQSFEVLFVNDDRLLMNPYPAISTSPPMSPASQGPTTSTPLTSFMVIPFRAGPIQHFLSAATEPPRYQDATVRTQRGNEVTGAPSNGNGAEGHRGCRKHRRRRQNSIKTHPTSSKTKQLIGSKWHSTQTRGTLPVAVVFNEVSTSTTSITSETSRDARTSSDFVNNNKRHLAANYEVDQQKRLQNVSPLPSSSMLLLFLLPSESISPVTAVLFVSSDKTHPLIVIDAKADSEEVGDNIESSDRRHPNYNKTNDPVDNESRPKSMGKERGKRNLDKVDDSQRPLKTTVATGSQAVMFDSRVRVTSFVQQTQFHSSHQCLYKLHKRQPQLRRIDLVSHVDNDGVQRRRNEAKEMGGRDSDEHLESAEKKIVKKNNVAKRLAQNAELLIKQQTTQRSTQESQHQAQSLFPQFLQRIRPSAESRSSIKKRSSSDDPSSYRITLRRNGQREKMRNEHSGGLQDMELRGASWFRTALPFRTETERMAEVVTLRPAALSQRSKFGSSARGALTRQNCSMLLDKGYLPTGAETFAVLGRWGVLLCCMETGMVLVTLAVFSRECLYLYYKWPPRAALLSCAALSVFPFTAICALSAAIFPHMYDVASALVMLYLPFSLVMYYELVATYAGGCHVLWELLTDQRMPLKGPPLCCVLPPCCGPGPILTRKRQRLMRYFIYQLLAVPLLLVGVIFVCTLAGVHPGDRLEATNASPYLMLIQALSFVLGTYALVICVKLAARHLPQHALRRKFTVFHLHYTVTRLQVIFFKLTGLTASLPCIPPLSSMASGIYMSCAMLIGQCFLMSTVSQYFFLHAPPVTSLDPEPELVTAVNGSRKRSGRDPVAVSGGVNQWLLSQTRSNCQSNLRQNSMPIQSVVGGSVAGVRSNTVDYSDETFSSEPTDVAASVAPSAAIQPIPPQQLSAVLTAASNNLINNNNNIIINNNNTDSNNLHHHLGVPRRVNAHAPLGRALSHPVSATGINTGPSLSIGGLRRAPLSAPEPVTAPALLQCGAPANRAKLTLDLKDTHTMTLDRKQRRRPMASRATASLEDELDLEVSAMTAAGPAATHRLQRENDFLFRSGRPMLADIDDRLRPNRRGRSTADLCNNPLMTCSLDEALRIRELRERRARLWRVSVAGGERWGSQASPWLVTSLEAEPEAAASHLSSINHHGEELGNAWIEGAPRTVPQHWLRQVPDWELTGSGISPSPRRLSGLDFVARRPDVSTGWTRCHPISGNEQYC